MFRDSQRGENTLDMTSRFLQERALKIARNVQHGSAAAGGARADCCGKVKWSSAHLPPLYCARPEPTKASTRREQRGLRRKCMPASFALGLHTGRVILSLSFFNPFQLFLLVSIVFLFSFLFFEQTGKAAKLQVTTILRIYLGEGLRDGGTGSLVKGGNSSGTRRTGVCLSDCHPRRVSRLLFRLLLVNCVQRSARPFAPPAGAAQYANLRLLQGQLSIRKLTSHA